MKTDKVDQFVSERVRVDCLPLGMPKEVGVHVMDVREKECVSDKSGTSFSLKLRQQEQLVALTANYRK